MRNVTLRRSFVALLAAGLPYVVGPTQALAVPVDPQPDINNVLLLVDSSGSMEAKSSSEDFPVCLPSGGGASERSRWIELVESLTGSIENYRCFAQDRSSTEFQNEYTFGGLPPYDLGYVNPYHRPLSGICTTGPGTLSSNTFEFPPSAIKHHTFNSLATPCTNFAQAGDGLLDAFRAGARFSLMTFDTLPSAGSGYSGALAEPASGMDGSWSYYIPTKSRGKPAACQELQDLEVGVRNAAAPPWEGRLIAFGDPYASEAAMLESNEQIQKVLLSTRPFGATPIAGMLHDARDFLWNDTTAHPLHPAKDFGPRNDPFLADGCRRNVVLLLTDGEPNTDLRPECEGLGAGGTEDDGVCPYERPEDIAYSLFNPGGIHASRPPVEVYVIGFALPDVTVSGSPVDCKTFTEADLVDPNGVCVQNPGNKALQACCVLNRIAFNGWEGPNGERKTAFFVSSQEELRLAIQKVLSSVSTTNSRTQPTAASGMSAAGGVDGSYRFYSSFVPTAVDLWPGVLERQRIECKTDPNGERVPTIQDFDAQKGDDFAANMNSSPPGDRVIYSVIGTQQGPQIYSQRSLRPHLTADDGAGTYGGTTVGSLAQGFSALVPPAAMSVNSTTCPGLSDTACRDRYMNWQLGLGGTSRCPVAGDPVQCRLLASIFHSTPQPVGRPQGFVRDESYQRFALEHKTRPLVLYTSSTDGQLHVFKVAPGSAADSDVDTRTNNELWSFMPPAVLPSIPAQYPAIQQQLLDGTPVISDVPAIVQGGVYHFRRTASEAQKDDKVTSGSPIPTWRTVLVQGFGPTRGGYFAVDITEPVPDFNDPATGPRFLWQLTSDNTGQALFGQGSGSPAIAILSFDADGDGKPTDIAVAILPGGPGGTPTGECPRKNATPVGIDPAFAPRATVPCYPTAGASRSLTIVRLDTGEIVRTFRRTVAETSTALQPRTTATDLDSPIVGKPVPYPAGTGSAADRIFIGDRDGTIWKVDVSAIDPSLWTMAMFFDTYPEATHDFDDGQPVATEPVASVDPLGNVTLAVATGDQEVLVATPGVDNYVWALKELVNDAGNGYYSKGLWYKKFGGGERATGPLTLFDSRLFFATYLPQPSSASPCVLGTTTVWGMHYILPFEDEDLSQGGGAQFADPTDSFKLKQSVTGAALLGGGEDDRAAIHGISIAQKPTCNKTDETFDDPYLGYGSHTSINSLNPGKFELVMHTGRAGQGVQGGSATHVLTVELPTPMQPARVDSWAAIVE